MQSKMITRSLQALVCGASLLVLGGCPKHEDLPTALEVVTAPAPSNFEIIANGINSGGSFDYDLTWAVSDGTNVDRYRLYLVGAGIAPELVHETTPAETAALTLPISIPFNAEGLQFGLSTVSTGSIESGTTIATIPAPLP